MRARHVFRTNVVSVDAAAQSRPCPSVRHCNTPLPSRIEYIGCPYQSSQTTLRCTTSMVLLARTDTANDQENSPSRAAWWHARIASPIPRNVSLQQSNPNSISPKGNIRFLVVLLPYHHVFVRIQLQQQSEPFGTERPNDIASPRAAGRSNEFFLGSGAASGSQSTSGQARHRAGSREFLNDLLQFAPVRYEQGIVRGIDNGISRWRSQDPILWKQHCRWTRIVQRLCVGSQHERGPGHDRTSHLTGARPSWRQNVLDSGITWIHTLSKLVLEQRIVKVKRSRSVSVDLRCNRVQRTIASCV